jgi:hypothetical protein
MKFIHVILSASLLALSAVTFANDGSNLPDFVQKDITAAKDLGAKAPKAESCSKYSVAKYGAEWCGWCRFQHSVMSSYMEGLKTTHKPLYDMELIVNIGHRAHEIPYKEFNIEKDLKPEELQKLNVAGIPLTIITGPDGETRRIEGYANIETIEKEIRLMEKERLEMRIKALNEQLNPKSTTVAEDSKVDGDGGVPKAPAPVTDGGVPAGQPDMAPATKSDAG